METNAASPGTQTDFIVRQSVLINTMLAVFFFLVFAGLVLTFLADTNARLSVYIKPFAGVTCFLIIAIVNTRRRKEIYRINHSGIYYYGKLVTGWDGFYTAYVSDDSNFTSVNDNIKLMVQYYASNGQLVEKRLPAPPTLDRSVYEIMEVIRGYVNPDAMLNEIGKV